MQAAYDLPCPWRRQPWGVAEAGEEQQLLHARQRLYLAAAMEAKPGRKLLWWEQDGQALGRRMRC